MGSDLESALIVWMKKYKHGLNNRFSARIAKPPRVKKDPILEHVLRIAQPDLSVEEIGSILKNHIAVMAIENNIGSLLEDYIASKLQTKGWISAWGSTLHAVDFYEPKENKFLQIKNRSNSENSSSMAIRKGTDIKNWYRINAQNGKTGWKNLRWLQEFPECQRKGFQFLSKMPLLKIRNFSTSMKPRISKRGSLPSQALRTHDRWFFCI